MASYNEEEIDEELDESEEEEEEESGDELNKDDDFGDGNDNY